MLDDLWRRSKYSVDKPYPEAKVERKNVEHANLLLGDYAGQVSEFTAISLYSFQHFVSDEVYKDYAEVIEGIAVVEMKHLELVGETIKLLGVKPAFTGSFYNGTPWNGCFVNYTTNILDMLMEDIRSEEQAIRTYEKHICLINDNCIKKLLERIILDERLHLKLFNELLHKYSKEHKCD